MEEENGFFIDEKNLKTSVKRKVEDLSFDSNIKCVFCDSPFIDNELKNIFNLSCCTQCRFKNIKFVTKTTATKDFLLSDYDLKGLKFVSRPNPHKGNWHDMILYMEDEVKKISMNKYGDEEKIEQIKINRVETVKNRKIKKLKTKIRDLKRRTFVKNVVKEKHTHDFEVKGTKKTCKGCGLKIEQEDI